VLLATENNFDFIELDFTATADMRLIAAHGWDIGITPTEAEFKNILNKYTPLDAQEVAKIFKSHPTITLVTDKIRDLQAITESFGFLEDRLIVEVFSIEDYQAAIEQGIAYPAFNVQYKKDLNQVIKNNIRMITVSGDFLWANKFVFEYLHQNGVTILMYGNGVNDDHFLSQNLGKYFSMVYTDFLTPNIQSK
jgi:hypothetical protein